MRGLAVSIVAVVALVAPQAQAAGTTKQQQQTCRNTTKTLTNCPDIGCPANHHPNLNRAKNRTDDATSPTSMTISDIVALNAKIDPSWTEDQAPGPIEAVGEGKAVVVEGYLVYAHGQGAESCNCYLLKQTNGDFHLNLVETSQQAHLSVPEARKKSVVVEITPRIRRHHPGWKLTKLTAVAKNHGKVRVTGWLMLDTAHVVDHLGGPRATLWEVHPVTQFEVRAHGQWVPLESFQPH